MTFKGPLQCKIEIFRYCHECGLNTHSILKSSSLSCFLCFIIHMKMQTLTSKIEILIIILTNEIVCSHKTLRLKISRNGWISTGIINGPSSICVGNPFWQKAPLPQDLCSNWPSEAQTYPSPNPHGSSITLYPTEFQVLTKCNLALFLCRREK